MLDDEREIPAWIDGVLRKALQPDPRARHETLSEFVHDLRHPGAAFLRRSRAPLVERHPVLFWKVVSVLLALLVVALLAARHGVA